MENFSDRYLNFYTKQRKPYKGKSFLWPVWGWQILTPEPSRNALNIFQRSILGLIQTRKKDPDDIALWLGIKPEMVRYIIAGQLQPNGWIDNRGKLTELGEQMLNSDLDARRNLMTAYVFQDAFSGNLWPRVINDLPDIEADSLSTKGFPIFVYNRETGRKDEPFVLPCRPSPPDKPDSEALRDTIRKGNNAIHNQRVRGELSDQSQEELRIDEIEYIEHTPFPAYVFCWMVPDLDYGWAIADPIGISKSSDWMRESVHEQAKKSSTFARRLKDFIGEQPEAESWKVHADRIDSEVEFEVFADFPEAGKVPELARYLGALLRREQYLREVEDGKERFEDCSDLIAQAQNALEACFKWMLKDWPLDNVKTIRKEWKRHEVRACLERIGEPFLKSADLDSLATVHAGRLYSAARFREQSLKPLVAATIITLPAHTDHPLFGFRPEQLDISKILELAETRNKASHASGKRISKKTALGLSDFTKSWIQILTKTEK